MEKTLNDNVDGIFRGIVFIALDSISSLARLTFSPRRGALRLLQRLNSHQVEQVRPYVFLFLSLVAFPFVVLAAQVLAAHKEPLRFVFYRDGLDLFAPSPVRDLFDKFSTTLDSKVFLPILFGAIFGVTLLHIVLRVVVRVSFFNQYRRLSAINLFFYLAGAQVALLAMGALVQELWAHHHSARLSIWPLEIWGYLVSLKEKYAAMDRWLILTIAAFGIWALLLPWPAALLLAKRSRFCKGAQRGWRVLLFALGLTLAVDLALLTTCYITGYIQERGAQPNAMPYAIGDVSCRLSIAPDRRISALVIVNNTGSAPHLFENDSFELSMSAPSTGAPSSTPYGEMPARREYFDAGMSESVSGATPDTPVFLEPGKWALLHVVSGALDSSVLEWATKHRDDDVRCLVRDSDDRPAGSIGYVDKSVVRRTR